ncbi:MAG TPA: FIST N-terminal domain-containing protein [Ginsengibacter sp.]
MKTNLFLLSKDNWVSHPSNKTMEKNSVQLLLCFGEKQIFTNESMYTDLRTKFPNAEITMCSTAGEIYHNTVQDNTLVAVALEFEKTAIKSASVSIEDFSNSYTAAYELGKKLPKKDLSYIMIFSDGSLVNGSELVKGISEYAGDDVLVTGGLAGDGGNFVSTLVGLNEQPSQGKIVAIGLYGKNIAITHGSQGGWDMFGLEKEITKSNGNVLLEINDQSALELYKKYLGPDADDLPGSALLFPLSITIPGSKNQVVRTILSIDEERQSMTFAGDVPEGSRIRFMKANFDRLTAAASTAATQTIVNKKSKPDFSLLLSCVGRKIILGPRIEEEVEAVWETLGDETLLAGFYTYGEISPFNEGGNCQLHNQTMTITSFYELS